MSYSIVQSALNPPTQTTATAFFSASNDRAFPIRISVAASGVTIIPSTVIQVGGFLDGNATATGLSPGTTTSFVMTIRRSSTFEELGTRTVNITTLSAPPPSPPSWSSNFPTGQVGSGYSGSATATFPSGGTWGFLTAPSIPGLSLSQGLSSFSLSGTPSVAGTYSFSARATDDFNQSTDASFSITINPPPSNPTVPNVNGDTETNGRNRLIAAGFSVNTIYTSTSVQGDDRRVRSHSPSGTAPAGSQITMDVWLFSAPLPTVPNVIGLTSSQAVSTLAGAGYNVSSTATTDGADAGNSGTVKDYNPKGGQAAGTLINIVVFQFVDPTPPPPPPPPPTPTPPVWTDNVIVNTFIVGTPYSDSVSATNSPTYSISSGTLPAGISLNSSTGAITGTPTTAQVYSFTIRAANSDGAVTVSYNGTTSSPPVWVDQTLAAFLQGRAYSDAVAATQSPTYSVSVGSLPTGISLNTSTGAVTGTPSGSGAFSFTLRASNASGAITADFSGNIVLVPNWIDNVLGTVINGVEFTDAVSATNSPTYSVTSGTLPAGLSLNSSTGAVTGTPTGSVGTSYSFTITATNANGSISQAFSGTVQPDLTGQISYFDGTTWAPREVYAYDGTEWVLGTAHVFNGTSWVKSSF